MPPSTPLIIAKLTLPPHSDPFPLSIPSIVTSTLLGVINAREVRLKFGHSYSLMPSIMAVWDKQIPTHFCISRSFCIENTFYYRRNGSLVLSITDNMAPIVHTPLACLPLEFTWTDMMICTLRNAFMC